MITISLKPPVLIVLCIVVALVYVATAATTTTSVRREPPNAEELNQLTDKLEAARIENHVPGMVVVVVKDDEVVFLESFGYADLEKRTKVTEQTTFAIGSATKAMTAALIGMLVDEGLMDWDDPLRKHLPEVRIGDEETADQVTFRDLISHRSGLGPTDTLWYSGTADMEQILNSISRAELRRPFRTSFQYNNVGYLAAGEASARVAEMSWTELIQRRLFKPLGMRSATASLDGIDPDRFARGYQWDEDREKFRQLPTRSVANCAPAGAVNASALDMAAWLRFQLARGSVDETPILSRERIEEMWQPEMEIAPGIEYGLGWFVRDWHGRTLIEHGGNIDGFATQVALLPEENIGFAIMMNRGYSPLQAGSIPMIFSAFIDSDDEPAVVMNPDELESYIGEYGFAGFDRPVKAMVRDGRLALDVPGQMIYDLRPPDDDGKWRFLYDPNIAVAFEKDEDGMVLGLTIYQHGLELEMHRLGVERPAEVSRDEVEAYLGTYRFEALQNEVEVLIENGRLAVDVPDQMVYELHKPDEDGKWRFRVTDTIAVRFNRDEEGDVQSMTMHQGAMEFEMPKIADAGVAPGIAVKDLLERMRRAYGTAHVDALGTLRMIGTFDMRHQGISGDVTTIADGVDRWHEVVDLGVFGRIINAAGDEVAWSKVFDDKPEVLRGRYRDQFTLVNPIRLASDWREQFNEINYLRPEESDDGRLLHVLQVQYGEGVRMTAYVDDQSAHVVRMELRMMIRGAGAIPVSMRLSDYRPVNGVYLPHRYKTENNFIGVMDYRIVEIETDVEVPEGLFDPPEHPPSSWFEPIVAVD